MARKPRNDGNNAAEEANAEAAEDFSRDHQGQGTDTQGQDPEEARREAVEADEADEGEDGEGDGLNEEHEAGDADDEDPEADLAAMATVDHDADEAGARAEVLGGDEDGTGGLVGLAPALTQGQRAGIDPVDGLAQAREATIRDRLPNGQTTHEATNVLDGTSGTANTGIVGDGNHSQSGAAGMSDMSGNVPKPDPFASAAPQVRQAMKRLGDASAKALRDGKRGQGYMNLQELGVHKAVMDSLVEGGHVTRDERAGAAFMPETGVVYRIATHEEP